MVQGRYHSLIVETLVTAPGQRATLNDVYGAVVRQGAETVGHAGASAGDGEAAWQHVVRNAMQFLKGKGVIRYLGDGLWGLGEADWRPWVNGLASEADEDGSGETVAGREPAAASHQEAPSGPDASAHAPALSGPGDPHLLATPIEDVLMPRRLKRRLKVYGAQNLGDVGDVDEEQFAEIAGVGQGTIADLHELQAAITRGQIITAGEDLDPGTETSGHVEDGEARERLSLASPVRRLAMPTRLRNRLLDYGCATVGDMLRVDTARFAEQRGVGRTTMAQLRDLRAWIRRHVPGAGDVPIEDTDEQRDELRSQAGSALREAARDPERDMSAPGLTALAQFAPAEGPIASLADLLREVIDRVTRCRSGYSHERDAAIWLAYHGVTAGKPKTLEALGRKHSLSRGRVQQIVARMTRLARPLLLADKRYRTQLQAVRAAFASCLGVARLKEMLPMLERAVGWASPPTCEHLIALSSLLEGTHDAFAYDKGSDLVRHSQACTGLWDGLRNRVQHALDEVGEGQHLLDFAYSLGQRIESCLCPELDGDDLPIACCGARDGQVRLPGPYVKAVLSTIDPCPLYGDMVLGSDWATLRFGRLKTQVVAAALRIIGEPVHYSELAAFVRKHSRRWRHADDRNIHACLVTTDDFVTTEARGTYGLQEWDVRSYRSVADRVEDFLRRRGRPVPMWKIVEVFAAQQVPEGNVRACFGQQRFRRHSDGTIGLREWRNAGTQLPVAEHGAAGIFLHSGDDEFIMG